MGATPLSWMDIDAWSRIRCRQLSPTTIDLIRTIDEAFLNERKRQEG